MKGLWQTGTWTPDDSGGFFGEIDEDWCQGRTVFGGILATACVRAMQHRLGPGRPLRSVLVTFVAPVSSGPARIELEVLRSGRSFTNVDARVVQEDRICTRVTAGFGEGRDTCIQIPGPPRPEAAPPDGIEPMPYIPDLVPAFTQHFDSRWTSPFPFSGSREARIQGWIRPRDNANVDAAALLSLIDAWPPPELTTRDRPYPLSSVTWQTNLLTVLPEEGIPPDAWWFYDSHTTWADGGYSDSQATLWAPDGRPAANSRQLVAEFSADCSA